jgi:hypothetical protein
MMTPQNSTFSRLRTQPALGDLHRVLGEVELVHPSFEALIETFLLERRIADMLLLARVLAVEVVRRFSAHL